VTPLSNRVRAILDSPEGRRVIAEAKKLAKDPGTRRRIDDVRRHLVRATRRTP